MDSNFTFPRPQPAVPRPAPASSSSEKQTEHISRESNALRASVLDAALELGIGSNSVVANWMFNNSLQEEDEEEPKRYSGQLAICRHPTITSPYVTLTFPSSPLPSSPLPSSPLPFPSLNLLCSQNPFTPLTQSIPTGPNRFPRPHLRLIRHLRRIRLHSVLFLLLLVLSY
ncbi:hypothetical protein GALMADRAFT_1135798 [Galerina marginata CBS 339.88]|uniref:Uncharacterized protein n=1 Tax=Galerina marginata (strain CBS 339.88) TaxID=685588 RepID=A0A067S7T4_GALM3|nr:hypothetical protein GALMADRAFT_1135798 [Galerina marginata CBS 339.88]